VNILLVDDEADIRSSLATFIGKLGHTVETAADGNEGLRKYFQQPFDMVVTDIRMPGMDGIKFLRKIKQSRAHVTEVVVITGHGDMDNAISALRHGAYNYLQKPIDIRELAATIQRCADLAHLRSKYLDLKNNYNEQLSEELCQFISAAEVFKSAYFQEVGLDRLKYCSSKMQEVISLAEHFSRDRRVPVLIDGESGTGKELVARLIHYLGMGEENQPFVAINCGAISPELFEGELFGHEAGAFTGASRKGRPGKLAAADKGTLFLDEIGELPHAMQVKLLRVIEEKSYSPLGGIHEIHVDIRLLSATNKDLEAEVARGRFRLDLYHRLNVGQITIPPLRERRGDILLLATHFIQRACSRQGRTFERFSPEAEQLLKTADWPGNVRQLKNAMVRLSLLCPSGCFDIQDLAFLQKPDLLMEVSAHEEKSQLSGDVILPEDHFDLEGFTRRILLKALDMHHGNQTRTASYLGISRRVLQGRLKKIKESQKI
jgi:two-component system response regulator AtoC